MARFARRAGLLAFLVVLLALVPAAPLRAASSDGGAVLHVAHAGAAFVIAPRGARRMIVTVRGARSIADSATPVGATRLGPGVLAVQLPADLRPDEPIGVRVAPPGAGPARLVADDPAIDAGITAGRVDGIMLGILLAGLLFQIAVWTISRDPSIPFYAVFVISLALIELQRDRIFPSFPRIPPLAMLALLYGITEVAGSAFIVVYLRLWKEGRRAFWLLAGAEATKFLIMIAFAVLPPLQPHAENVRIPAVLIGFAVTLPIALARVRRFPPALSLVSALAFVMAGVLYRAVGQFTGLHDPFLNRWLYEIATAADALLFSIAVIVRARYVVRERRVLQARLDAATEAAEHDPLTGTLNRRGLFSRAAALASGTLFFLDLDGCEPEPAVEALHRTAPEDALVARIEGDQFVVVVAHGASASPELLAEHFSRVAPRASVGFVLLDGMPFENALRIANANAYRAKLRGSRT